MISFDFDYHRPNSIAEATDLYKSLSKSGKKVVFYGGGTEIICRSQANQMSFDAVIDIKEISECNELRIIGDKLVFGAALTLTTLCDSGLFPFLAAACRRSADHTMRDKITLGGNICGKTPYREALLPLLLSDAKLVIARPGGEKTLPLKKVFDSEIKIKDDEFLVQVIVDTNYAALPFAVIKKTKQEKVDYPLVTAAALKGENGLRVAFSGLCAFPFSLDKSNPKPDQDLFSHLPGPVLDDMLGSEEYRKFMARKALKEAMERIESV